MEQHSRRRAVAWRPVRACEAVKPLPPVSVCHPVQKVAPPVAVCAPVKVCEPVKVCGQVDAHVKHVALREHVVVARHHPRTSRPSGRESDARDDAFARAERCALDCSAVASAAGSPACKCVAFAYSVRDRKFSHLRPEKCLRTFRAFRCDQSEPAEPFSLVARPFSARAQLAACRPVQARRERPPIHVR